MNFSIVSFIYISKYLILISSLNRNYPSNFLFVFHFIYLGKMEIKIVCMYALHSLTYADLRNLLINSFIQNIFEIESKEESNRRLFTICVLFSDQIIRI